MIDVTDFVIRIHRVLALDEEDVEFAVVLQHGRALCLGGVGGEHRLDDDPRTASMISASERPASLSSRMLIPQSPCTESRETFSLVRRAWTAALISTMLTRWKTIE